ncbi:hypothetical protein D3C72_2276370 [compost metagenome]
MRTELAFAIGQLRRDVEFALAADLHAHHALVPALDHTAGADDALERLAAFMGRVENRTVFQGAGVVGRDQGALDDFLAFAQLNIFNFQFADHRSNSPLIIREGCNRPFER